MCFDVFWVFWGVLECVRVCLGVLGCVLVCFWVCWSVLDNYLGERECIRVCFGVLDNNLGKAECVRVCLGHKYGLNLTLISKTTHSSTLIDS